MADYHWKDIPGEATGTMQHKHKSVKEAVSKLKAARDLKKSAADLRKQQEGADISWDELDWDDLEETPDHRQMVKDAR